MPLWMPIVLVELRRNRAYSSARGPVRPGHTLVLTCTYRVYKNVHTVHGRTSLLLTQCSLGRRRRRRRVLHGAYTLDYRVHCTVSSPRLYRVVLNASVGKLTHTHASALSITSQLRERVERKTKSAYHRLLANSRFLRPYHNIIIHLIITNRRRRCVCVCVCFLLRVSGCADALDDSYCRAERPRIYTVRYTRFSLIPGSAQIQ